jgi:Kdo2-lipid IVA lauroyltransferase/acyltransferase
MTLLFRLLSHMPLWLLQAWGWLLGWAAFLLSAGYRQCFLQNVAQAGVPRRQWLSAVGESGRLVAELPRLWLGRPVPLVWDGAEHVQAALDAGRGIVFLTPHLGCFEAAARAYAQRFGAQGQPMTVLFRPPRKAWLRAVVLESRQRPGLATAPTTLAGVKQLIKALKAGQCVGLLPDQVPPQGLGVWAPFFGQPAYTMTLSARLALQTGAAVLVAWGERLSWGRGYVVHVTPLQQVLSSDMGEAAAQINHAMQALITQKPQQYLWGYARYRAPKKGAS